MIGESVAFLGYAQQGRLNYLNIGAGTAKCEIYRTPRPATPDDPPSNAKIVGINLTTPAGFLSGSALHLTPASAAIIQISGLASWARFYNANGDVAFDVDCYDLGDPEAVGELGLDSLALWAGGTFDLTTIVIE